MKNQDDPILRRKLTAMHFAKTEERLQFEEEHDCYLVLIAEGLGERIVVDGEEYFKRNKVIEGLQKVDVLDPKTAHYHKMMDMTAMFNQHRGLKVWGVWLPKLWAEEIKKNRHNLPSDIQQAIFDYKFSLNKKDQ